VAQLCAGSVGAVWFTGAAAERLQHDRRSHKLRRYLARDLEYLDTFAVQGLRAFSKQVIPGNASTKKGLRPSNAGRGRELRKL
jgi:hypothetical protein